MKKITGLVRWLTAGNTLVFANFRILVGVPFRFFSSALSERLELKEFTEYMEKLKNYEKIGVPKGAGTDSDDGFDLDRMRKLLHNLGNPHYRFKVIFSSPGMEFFNEFVVTIWCD